MTYWDTSGLVKLYAPESDSSQFEFHALNSAAKPIVAAITRLEMWVALRRKEADGFMTSGHAKLHLDRFDDDVNRGEIRVVELDDAVYEKFVRLTEECFSRVPPLLVRTLDMLHLATAQIAAAGEFVTTDKRLREAAAVMGFTLFPPSSPKSLPP